MNAHKLDAKNGYRTKYHFVLQVNAIENLISEKEKHYEEKMYGLGISVILSLVLLTPSLLLAGDNAAKPSKAEVVQKAQNLRMPFIANEGQVDEQIRYYAKTFSGTVYVTREGEIMYALPKYEEEVKDCRTPAMVKAWPGKPEEPGYTWRRCVVFTTRKP